ncbi:MAG: hypothetical protein AB7F28_07760 [Candidatus Margulisiibacteriota bacterium]
MPSWTTHSVDTAFKTAAENMAFDAHLAQTCRPQERWIRWYTWENTSVTFGHNQTLPEDLATIDAAKRLTGGGLVFHFPGDLLFTYATDDQDPHLPKSLAEKIGFFTERVQSRLRTLGLETTHPTPASPKNPHYCATYYSPYELAIGPDKVMGLTLRRLRKRLLVQGIIHSGCGDKNHFPSHYHPYITTGLSRRFPALQSLDPIKNCLI